MQSLKHRELRFQASGLARESSPVLHTGGAKSKSGTGAKLTPLIGGYGVQEMLM